MRSALLALALAAAAVPAYAGDDCAKAVEDAFNKQHQTKAYRVMITSPAQTEKTEDTFDYHPPMAMHRTLVAPGAPEPIETIGVGNRAWTKENGVWFELQPHYAGMTLNHLRELFGSPVKIGTPYNCLGKKTFEGKDYAAYQTAPETIEGGDVVARTIYIDEATGLPAFNVVGTVKDEKPLLVREAYAYSDDIKIEVPEGAPMMENKH